jgi:hypothetical protein
MMKTINDGRTTQNSGRVAYGHHRFGNFELVQIGIINRRYAAVRFGCVR